MDSECEIKSLKRQIEQLQSDNTRLLEARRAIDIHYNVEHFHRLFGVPVANVPHIPTEKNVRLRLRLIAEEFLELLEATLDTETPDRELQANPFVGLKSHLKCSIDNLPLKVNVVEIADALADMDYLNEGTRLVFGIDGRPIAAEVQRSNLAKFGAGTREDGKILKPEGWKPPDILGELRKQGYRE